MLYYPQLLSGAIAQFPIARRESHRTVTNTMPDGTTVRAEDLGFGSVRWQLSYSHLTQQESAAIETLFESAQGQLNSFVFLDPTDNLFLWSADPANAVWTKDPLLTVASGPADPNGGTSAFQLTNTGQAAQGIQQSLNAPSSLLYCFSLYASSASGASFNITASDAAGQISQPVMAGPGWSRLALGCELPTLQPSITFGIGLPPGGQISVFGLQVEAQRAPSIYKPTTDRSGVYPNSRFDSDSLDLIATGVNQNSVTVRLMSVVPD